MYNEALKFNNWVLVRDCNLGTTDSRFSTLNISNIGILLLLLFDLPLFTIDKWVEYTTFILW